MSATFSGTQLQFSTILSSNLYYKNLGENMATNAAWTVVMDDKKILNHSVKNEADQATAYKIKMMLFGAKVSL